jgi:hypothetical protein
MARFFLDVEDMYMGQALSKNALGDHGTHTVLQLIPAADRVGTLVLRGTDF